MTTLATDYPPPTRARHPRLVAHEAVLRSALGPVAGEATLTVDWCRIPLPHPVGVLEVAEGRTVLVDGRAGGPWYLTEVVLGSDDERPFAVAMTDFELKVSARMLLNYVRRNGRPQPDQPSELEQAEWDAANTAEAFDGLA